MKSAYLTFLRGVNVMLAGMLSMLGLMSCEHPLPLYGAPMDDEYVCLYGVAPTDWEQVPENSPEDVDADGENEDENDL